MKQLDDGVSFSLPHQLETIVAEKIVNTVPCAEMVRFGKNGSDATSAAIRLARAFTGREHVAVCGYHGWQDWYIGSTTRDLGVPESTKALTHQFQFNDIESLKVLLTKQSMAAVIMEPMNVEYPRPGFLAEVKATCEAHGAVLIFDETITGFRFSIGGAQQLFKVTPDLATFGKGMANGFPISAVVGRKDIMCLMEDIFFSGTFAGEAMSLAATNAVLDKLIDDNVLEHIDQMGQLLIDGLNNIIERNKAAEFMRVSGHPSWVFLHITDSKHHNALLLKSYYLQEMLARGILINASHNLSFSHKREDIEHLLHVYDEVIGNMVKLDSDRKIAEHFEGQVMKPVFKVR